MDPNFTRPDGTAASPAKSPTINLLLIESDEADAASIKGQLAEPFHPAGIEVTCAARLDEALRLADTGKFDVILLDLTLPDSRGLETYLRVQAHTPDTPVVVLTDLEDDAMATRSVELGAQDYLVKRQAGRDVLVRAVRYAIERHRMRMRLQLNIQKLIDMNTRLGHEINERRRAEDRLRSAQAELVEAVKLRSVGQLAAGVAHEVKNPLAILLSGVDFLARRLRGRDRRADAVLQDMTEAVERADRIIRGLLEFSAPSRLALAETSLTEVLAQSLHLVKHELEAARVKVHRDLADELPPVCVDRVKIEQVFVNLLVNAAHAMAATGGDLTVRTYERKLTREVTVGSTRFGPGEVLVAAEVEDTGAGIPADQLERIYEPFFTTKPAGQGTGLGLAVSRQILELHGGALDIGNRDGGGVHATLLLRAAAGGDPADPAVTAEVLDHGKNPSPAR